MILSKDKERSPVRYGVGVGDDSRPNAPPIDSYPEEVQVDEPVAH